MQVLDFLKESSFSELDLWFGKDTFCQMNLLTLLAYLEEMGFCGQVVLNYVEDETFEYNIKEAIAAGIKVGVYYFSQAITEAEAIEEANFVLEKIAPSKSKPAILF